MKIVYDEIRWSLLPREIETTSRILGVNGLRSLQRALTQLSCFMNNMLREIFAISHAVRSKSAVRRELWLRTERGQIEVNFIRLIHYMQEMTVAVDLYLDRLQACSMDEEKDEVFHVKLADPNKLPPPDF